jgi:hypothetical protein
MIRIPLTQNVQSAGQIAPTRSANEGNQSASAFDQLASTVSNVGQNIFDTSVKLQRIENERRVNELKAGLRKAQAEFQLSTINDHSPETWASRHKQMLDGYLSGAGADALPPEAKEQFQDWSTNFRSDQELQVKRDATIQTIKRSEQALQNNLNAYVENKNFAAAREEIQGSSLMSPEEKTASLFRIDKQEKAVMEKERIEGLQAEIMADPFQVEKEIKEGKYDDLGELTKQRAMKELRTAKNQITGDAIDQAREGMASGSITKPEQIDELFPSLSATAREGMKNEVLKRANAMDEAMRKSPQYQQQLVGEVSNLADGLDAADPETFDQQYAQASFMADQLEDSPSKRFLEAQLTEAKASIKKDPSDPTAKLHAQLKQELEILYPDLKAEPVAQEMSIQKAVSDKILEDPAKLSLLFGEDPPKFEGRDSKAAESFRMKFGELSPDAQEAGLARLSPIDRVVFEGIRDRKGFSHIVSHTSKEAEQEAYARRRKAYEAKGRILMELNDWLATPEGAKATLTEKTDKLFDLSKGEVRRNISLFVEQHTTPRP